MCVYFNTQIPPEELKRKFNSLKPVAGTCIFIDMCNSTQLKQRKLEDWILMIANTFNLANTLLREYVVKLIGDELMIYIPDFKLGSENYATIFDFVKCLLSNFHNEIDDITLRLKASIHYCEDVYNITFLENHNDYYGNGIDLTARLMTKAKEKRIVISESFFERASALSPEHFDGISDKYIEDFKGFSNPTEFRILDIDD